MFKAKELTERQDEVLGFIISQIEMDCRVPTIRDIGKKFKMSSTGTVRDVIAALIKKGYLVKDKAISRGIKLNPLKYTVRVAEHS